jgi:hypothetical protein
MHLRRLIVPAGMALSLLAAFSPTLRAAVDPLVNPWVATDRSVNCFDSRSLVADVTRGLTDPQDQAIALFSFFQRVMFPYTNRNEYPFPVNDQQHMFDFLRMVNVYGYALCTQTNTMFASLLKQSGLFEDARSVSVPGHGTAEVKWNGRWHFMDPIVGVYVFRRDRREIASIADIVADTTLLTRALKEGRASMPFFPWDGEKILAEEALTDNDQWFGYRKYGMSFLLGALPGAAPWGEGEKIAYTAAFSLRPGYRLTRLWDNLPGMYNLSYDYYRDPHNRDIRTPSPAILPPHHPDLGRERRDTLNFPVLEPYRKAIGGQGSYQYYANGFLEYEDRFVDQRLSQAADSLGGLSVAPGRTSGILRCAPGAGEGAAVLGFEAPYVFVGGAVTLRAQVGQGAWAAVYVDVKDSRAWMLLGLAERSGEFTFQVPKEILDERYAFRLKLALHDSGGRGTVTVSGLEARAVCQLNMHALPFLAPGTNRVTALAERIPAGRHLAVTWNWLEKGRERTMRRVVAAPGETWTVEVEGGTYPRMKSVVLECLPE